MLVQRHIKRLLAFSTISHVGMFICGIALLTAGVAGVAVYVVGHGLTKAALFMCAGILLHRFATVDEFDLWGGAGDPGRRDPDGGGRAALGRDPPVHDLHGQVTAGGGSSAVGYSWLIAVFIIVSAVTGGSVLRVVGRVFLGWGPREGGERFQERVAVEAEPETLGPRDHTPGLMVVVPAVLLVGVLVLGLIPGGVTGVERLAAQFTDHRLYAAWVLHYAHLPLPTLPPSHVSAGDYLYGGLSTAGALTVAACGLLGARCSSGFHASSPRRGGLC